MDRGMAHGAGLIFLRKVVRGTNGTLCRRGVALQAQKIDLANFQEARVVGAVWSVAASAALGLYRQVFESKGSLLVGMTLVANSISAGHSPRLARRLRSVQIVAIAALHQPLIHPMAKRLGEVSLRSHVASVAQLGLRFDQQVLALLGVVWRVTIQASDVVARMH